MRGIEQNPRRFWDIIYGESKSDEGSGQLYLNLFSGFRPPVKDGKPKEPNKNKLQGVTDNISLGLKKRIKLRSGRSKNPKMVGKSTSVLICLLTRGG